MTYGDSNPTFSVAASGDVTGYQWEVSSDNGGNWAPVNGATSTTYTVINPTVAMNGYQFRAAVTGCNTTIYSNAATLIVNQRPLTITVNPKTKVYGDPLPTFDGTFTGLLSSDNISVSYSSAATATDDVATYPIIATISDPNKRLGNYKVDNTPALLTITPAPATITLADLAKTYNGSSQGATVTTTPANLTGVAVTYDGSTTAPTAAGTYQVVASLSNANYTAQSVSGTLVISKASATVTLSNLEHTYDGIGKAATATTSAKGSSTFTITYDGSTDLPVNYKEGGYAVVATLENANYSGSATGTLEIKKADQVISWANPAGITYGTALSATQLNASVTTGNGTLTYTPAAGAVLGAGAHNLTVSAAETNNYKPAQKTVQMNVAKATPTIILTVGGPYTYDGSGKAVNNATVSGVGGEDLGAATVTYELENKTVTSPVNAGNYNVLATFAGNDNYTTAQATGTLVIGKAALAISAADATKVYGDANPAFAGLVVSGGAGGESFTVTASSDATTTSPIGNYSIVPAVNGSTIQNYTVTATNGTLTISPRPITIAANTGQTKVYGDNDPAAFTYQISAGSLVDPSHLTGALTRNSGNNVGTYAITQGTLAVTSNYTLTYTGADFTITRRAVSVTADALSKVYGETDPALTYTVTSGSVVSGDNFTGKLARDKGEDVGDYAVKLGDLSLGNNYSLSLVPGTTFGITPKAITVTPVANQSKIYGSQDPVFAYTNTALVGSDAFSGALARASGEDAGTYAILQGSLALNSNYTLNFTPGLMFRINPKEVTASITASDKVYDGTTLAMAVGAIPNELVGSDKVEVSVTNARFSDKNAGTGKTVTADVAISNGNYSLSSTTASTKAAITAKPITGSFVAASRLYDGTVNASASNLSLVGVITGDDVQLTGGAATFANKHVGNGKTVSLAGASLTGDDKDNYSLTTIATASANITPKPASVTSDANTKVYGASDPTLTGSMSGFIAGDGITAAFSRSSGETVGNYSITATLSPEAALSNYSISYTPANFEITKAQLTVTADNKSRVYGDPNPQLTISYSGFVRSESESVLTHKPEISTSATITSNVGNYPITVSGGEATNYSFVYEAGVLIINKADIAVTASDKSRIYGDENPAFTGNITGIKNEDNITANYSSVAVASSPVGTYAIVPSLSGGALSNYNTPAITNGKLTINKANLTVKADDATKVYGDANPTFSGELTGIKNNDAITASYTTTAGLTTGVGNHTITAGVSATQAILNNYNLTATDGVLTITARPVTVTAVAKEKYCGQADPTLTYTISNGSLVGSDAFTGALSRISGDGIGTYTIQQGSLALSNNYTLSFQPANLTIKGVTLDANNASTPRSYTSTITITVTVKDGTTNLSGVPVSLKVDNTTYGPVNSIDGVATFTINPLAVNVYQVKAITVSGCSESTVAYMPVYDPDGNFVTGGGWIDSPAGALASDAAATGKANFGFVSKYKKGSNQVDGNTEFQFSAGSINFKSTFHEAGTLVIAGAKAMYRGEGTVNGVSGYKFSITAIDGNWNNGSGPDKFRIKITKNGVTVYDNGLGADENSDASTALGGGSIVIHEVKTASKGSKLEIAEKPQTSQFYNYPNSFSDNTTIAFSLDKEESYLLEVFDMRGVLIRKVDMGVAIAGKLYELGFDGSNLSDGLYIARLRTSSGTRSIKMILKK
ncbi:T9SS type A sorting domain-containing protein [Pontibacter sp. Tf4]|uniref:MBG domain-containing protein n=1 Tax=Pontibacter sp. Tf4 TaxID=2761620 RepID=UPI001627C9F0|nr:MBG domain-containing protein [Pontibacter sp. Tf4]MBB6610168.1 T9SS type A sorting domain-containing protein [Pontibacter sp. Tf4]